MPRLQSRTCYVGIDPGKSGGIAWISQVDGTEARKMPATERDVWTLLSDLNVGGVVAVIEKVGGFRPGRAQPGSAMFNFGWGYGGLRMALIAAQIPFDEVMPKKWQQAFGLIRKDTEKDTAWKNRIKAAAQRLFPQLEVTLATADALLIALYCKRKNEGTL